MAKSKKVRAYVDLVKQIATANKNLEKLCRSRNKLYEEMSQNERDEYQRIIHAEALEREK